MKQSARAAKAVVGKTSRSEHMDIPHSPTLREPKTEPE
jgi:hypothetical protein